MRRLWPWLLVVLALAPALLVHAARPAVPSTVRQTLTVAVFDQPNALDPATASTMAARLAADNVFQTLFRVAPNGNLIPDLAESASVNGLRITLRLRRRRLVDGKPVTALMVGASLAHVLWPDTHSPYAGLLADVVGAGQVAAGRTRWLTGISVNGRLDLTIRLKRPDPGFLVQLANPGLAIIPVRDLSRGGPYWTATDLIGSGGYRLSAWTPGSTMEFTAAAGVPGPRRVQIVWYPRLSEAALALLTGQVSVVPVAWTDAAWLFSHERRAAAAARFLADGGQEDLLVPTGTATVWSTPAAATLIGRVDLARVVQTAFWGRVPANPGALATLSAGSAPPPPGPGNAPGTVPATPGVVLPLAVSSADPQALRLAEVLGRLYPHLFQVTVLSPAALASTMVGGGNTAVLMTVPAGSAPTLGGRPPTVVALAPSGGLWLLAPGLRGASAYPDGALDWHGIR
jgi:ABC-type transport system substrate-binding protein